MVQRNPGCCSCECLRLPSQHVIPTFNDRNTFNGYINPYYCVYDYSLLYMEMMGVERIDHTYHLDLQIFDACKEFQHIFPNGGLMVKVNNHLLTTYELRLKLLVGENAITKSG